MRYTVSLEEAPTHNSAGYFAQLPDGGMVPGRAPNPIAFSESGNQLPIFVLWHNQKSGFSVVFATPEDGSKTIEIYVRPDGKPQYWTPDSGLTPSAILAGDPTQGTSQAAQSLSKLGAAGPSIEAINKAGVPFAPLSIGGHENGRPRPGSFYLLSHVDVSSDPGEFWIAPLVLDGETEVLVNGEKLNPTQQYDKWGGKGNSVELAAGIHRIEILQTAPGNEVFTSARRGGGQRDGGLMFLTWKSPNDNLREQDAARVVKEQEIVRSGSCNLVSVEAEDGRPVACVRVEATLPFWVGDEAPLLAYHFEALPTTDAPDTTYTWTFANGAEVQGSSVWWLFPGFEEHEVRLTARSEKGTTTSVYPFFGFSTNVAKFEDAGHRETFRQASATMLQASPSRQDGINSWTDGHWNNLIRTLELGEGHELLSELFSNHWRAIRDRLSPGQLQVFQDVFLTVEERKNPQAALKWLQSFGNASPTPERRNELKIREAEVTAYYLDNLQAASEMLLAPARTNTEQGDRAKVRLGDFAFMAGDLNRATELYLEVQNRARRDRNLGIGSVQGLVVEEMLTEPESGSSRNGTRATPTPSPTPSTPFTTEGVATWKAGALQDVSFSENIQTLIAGGYLLEASRALRRWERAFPMSKLSEDLILREADLYMKLKDWKRAGRLLYAYCRQIDASSFLPEAARMLVECSRNYPESYESTRELIIKLRERLKFHPVAAELDQFLTPNE